MISNKTDIQIFIEHHRGHNQVYQKEQFQPYVDESHMPAGNKQQTSKFMIDDNYISKSGSVKS